MENEMPYLPNEIHNIIFSYVIKNKIWKTISEIRIRLDFFNFFYFHEDHITFKDYHFRKLFLRKLLK
jgi:hypothetical protein